MFFIYLFFFILKSVRICNGLTWEDDTRMSVHLWIAFQKCQAGANVTLDADKTRMQARRNIKLRGSFIYFFFFDNCF